MTQTTLKVKNGSITLPKEVRKYWKNAEVYIRISGDTAILKRVQQPRRIFEDKTVRQLTAIGKKISNKDITDAIKWARSQKSA